MKKIFSGFFILAIFISAFSFGQPHGQAVHFAATTKGYILLQVEKNGEAWYVYPKNGERYFLGRPSEAFAIMQKLSLGAKHAFITNTEIFPANLSGLILLDVESNGEAYYIYPGDLKKYYLGRPADAFSIMRDLGLGITNQNLTAIPVGDITNKPQTIPAGSTFINGVPFTSQAPFGDWSDSRQQNGCEESSALMAVSWARGQSLTKAQALDAIITIADFLQEKHGESRDTSAQNTLDWIIKGYFNHQKARLIKNASLADIITELHQGNLVIAPMDGQLMHNPNYTPPGPARHMVVITGHDADKRIFITNDPGTRLGAGFRYDINVFYSAIRDYPTGYHELIDQVEKNIIVLEK